MKLSAHVYEGLLNLFSSKLRSMLALLGILVGTASVVAMVSGGKLAANEALKQFKTLGIELLAVSIKDTQDGEQSNEADTSLSVSQATSLVNVNKNILIVAPYTQVFNNAIQFNARAITGSILGVTEEFSNVIHVELTGGRFISNMDGYNFYCVIGNNIFNQIKEESLLDPIGQQIQMGKNIFTIVGVAKPWPESSFLYANVDDSIMIPIATSILLSKYSAINNIVMRLSPQANIDNVKSSIENYLHDCASSNNYIFRSAKELLANMSKQSEIFTIFLGLIGGISLLVGGIGVMNIMLVSIIERKREIGIRRAVGATRADIRYLFLVEALMLSLLGGVMGAIIGIFIGYLVTFFWNWSFTLFLLPPLIGFSVSAVIGIFFGFYPAHKASLLDPIESLYSI